MALSAEEIAGEVERLLGRGVEAAARWLNGRVKEVLSVPAPRRTAVTGPRSRAPGVRHYVATTAATPGAPPRKLSGRLRASMSVDFNAALNVARVGTNVVYARRHEAGTHPFLVPTLRLYAQEVAAIVGGRPV